MAPFCAYYLQAYFAAQEALYAVNAFGLLDPLML
jgi:hypothetical protein